MHIKLALEGLTIGLFPFIPLPFERELEGRREDEKGIGREVRRREMK